MISLEEELVYCRNCGAKSPKSKLLVNKRGSPICPECKHNISLVSNREKKRLNSLKKGI